MAKHTAHQPVKANAPKPAATAATVTPGTVASAPVASGAHPATLSGAGVLADVDAAASFVGGLLGAGKLSLVDDVARTAVKAAVATLDNGVDLLRDTIDKDIAATPIAATAITMSKTILSQLGIKLPDEQQIVTGVKAAIADLAGALTPPASAAA